MDERNYQQNLNSAYELAEKHYNERLEKLKDKELKQKLADAEKLHKKVTKQQPYSEFEMHD